MRFNLATFVVSAGLFGLACGGVIDNKGPAGGQDSGGQNPGSDSGVAVKGGDTGAPVKQPDPCKPHDAPSIFRNAVCLCGDFAGAGALLVKNGVTVDPASVGINGLVNTSAYIDVQGPMAVGGNLNALIKVDVKKDLWVGGNVDFKGQINVGGDMNVGGNLFGIGVLSVDGKLGVAGSNLVLGDKSSGSKGAYAALPKTPCACGADQVLDVQAKVAEAKTANDNASAGLAANPIDTLGKTRLVLNTGRYYFGSKEGIGYTKIVANGAVSVFIDGDYEAVGYDRFEVTEGSSLDFYVAGNVKTVGNMVLGKRHHPSAFRIYIGGSEAISIQVGNNIFRGSIYAPKASLSWVGNTKVEGSLFAKTVTNVGLLDVSFARPTTGSDGDTCTPEGGSPPPPPEDGDPPKPKDLPRVL